jgi:hypothetical protein
MQAGYVRNLVRHPRVRVKLRKGFGARWHTGTAHVLPDDDPRERQRWLASQLAEHCGECGRSASFWDGTSYVRIDLDA